MLDIKKFKYFLLLFFFSLFIFINFLTENAKYRYRFQQGPCVYNAIYNQKNDIDLLIIGGSRFFTVMDHNILKKELEKNYKGNFNVVSFSRNWSGPDYSYIVLRDLLEKRKVKKILIMAEPRLSETYHILFYSIAKFKDRLHILISNDNQNFIFNLSTFLKMSIKQIVDMPFKRNKINDIKLNNSSYGCIHEVGDGVNVKISKSYRYQYENNYKDLKPLTFDFQKKEYSHSRYFFDKIKNLTKRYDVDLIFFHLPRLMDPLWQKNIYKDWQQYYSSPIITLPDKIRDDLYNNFSFYDGAHLNKNGREVLLPWLAKHPLLKF